VRLVAFKGNLYVVLSDSKIVVPFEVYNNQHQLLFAVVADPTSG